MVDDALLGVGAADLALLRIMGSRMTSVFSFIEMANAPGLANFRVRREEYLLQTDAKRPQSSGFYRSAADVSSISGNGRHGYRVRGTLRACCGRFVYVGSHH